MRIPILTYHAYNAGGDDYATNDHVALESDLRTLHEMGAHVVALSTICEFFASGAASPRLDGPCVGISFDDGTNYDFIDFYHPDAGLYKSFYNTIVQSRLYQAHAAATSETFATAFVIASPQARAELDVTCIAGRNQWRDDWWLAAALSGVFTIANHSWDHLHPSLSRVAQQDQEKGSFHAIRNRRDADSQILDAQDYLESKLGDRAGRLFAFPDGHASAFLVKEYFPTIAQRITAAFSTDGRHVTGESDRWNVPRFVCGDHWKDPVGFRKILDDAFST